MSALPSARRRLILVPRPTAGNAPRRYGLARLVPSVPQPPRPPGGVSHLKRSYD